VGSDRTLISPVISYLPAHNQQPLKISRPFVLCELQFVIVSSACVILPEKLTESARISRVLCWRYDFDLTIFQAPSKGVPFRNQDAGGRAPLKATRRPPQPECHSGTPENWRRA